MNTAALLNAKIRSNLRFLAQFCAKSQSYGKKAILQFYEIKLGIISQVLTFLVFQLEPG